MNPTLPCSSLQSQASVSRVHVLWLQKAKAAAAEEPEEAEEDDSEDELPLAAVAGTPSDEELREATMAILKTVQLEDFTMKDLLRRLGAQPLLGLGLRGWNWGVMWQTSALGPMTDLIQAHLCRFSVYMCAFMSVLIEQNRMTKLDDCVGQSKA